MGYTFQDPKFWEERLKEFRGNFKNTVQSVSDWEATEKGHKATIEKFVKGKVLDVGCDYGRIIPFLPKTVTDYVGIDIAPIFIEEAQKRYPNHKFILGDARATGFNNKSFDWAIIIGIGYDGVWKEWEKEVRRVCKNVLILWCEGPNNHIVLKLE